MPAATVCTRALAHLCLIFSRALAASSLLVFDLGESSPLPPVPSRWLSTSASQLCRPRSGQELWEALSPRSHPLLGCSGGSQCRLLAPVWAAVPGAGRRLPSSAAFGASAGLRGSGSLGWLRQQLLAPPEWLHPWLASPLSASEQACCCPTSRAPTLAEELGSTSPRPRSGHAAAPPKLLRRNPNLVSPELHDCQVLGAITVGCCFGQIPVMCLSFLPGRAVIRFRFTAA